ncbi:cobalamin B12-binding domain-containing protein [Piscinibacter sakaiensis]|uniref:PpaA protein n=1 Tax=Piscinibacter sakaiensis TaxID=1547922 RepID=A0A0K8NVH0_PISS1|nr:cobalamin B12-binding domain-containing protein [Piscinibacter sakaiensis]GAP34391.1 PpaA protein [Piscinibacter sakaiensis]
MQVFRQAQPPPGGNRPSRSAAEPAQAQAQDGEDCAASLRSTIEAEIIPRLMLAHRGEAVRDRAARDTAARAGVPVGEDPVEALARCLLDASADEARHHVRGQLLAGVPLESLYLDLLAPAAQRLGALWEADRCDFTQVTVGLWRLQQIVHEVGRRPWLPVQSGGAAGRRALLMPAEGSQHTFGLLLVGEFFRRAGWDVAGDPTLALDQATALLAGSWFDVVGISIGSECHVEGVASAILALRKASLNPTVAVLVGGPVVPLWPDFVVRVGADATAPDAASAVAVADALVSRRDAAA